LPDGNVISLCEITGTDESVPYGVLCETNKQPFIGMLNGQY
jgi:hypothetical protein